MPQEKPELVLSLTSANQRVSQELHRDSMVASVVKPMTTQKKSVPFLNCQLLYVIISGFVAKVSCEANLHRTGDIRKNATPLTAGRVRKTTGCCHVRSLAKTWQCTGVAEDYFDPTRRTHGLQSPSTSHRHMSGLILATSTYVQLPVLQQALP